jgi:UDP-glucose 4-epimerase
MKIFIVGGAGYIGSHMVKSAHKSGHEVITIDNLSTGHRDAVLYGKFELCDIFNTHKLNELFKRYKPDVVMHFAASSLVGESVVDPYKYYYNNVSGTLNLLKTMIDNSCKKIVFSSSAAIFGNPVYIPIDEDHPKEPTNPYGKSKLMIENILKDFHSAYGLKYISLRYFNAAGHDSEGELTERHNPETHLLPIVMQVAKGERELVSIFGTDYKTKDGTCVRDYVYIEDLTTIHLKSLDLLFKKGFKSTEFNIGSGVGYSVKEVIQEVSKIIGKHIEVADEERRAGDPPILIAHSNELKKELDDKMCFSNLENIIKTLI